jgi:hypothetical protein
MTHYIMTAIKLNRIKGIIVGRLDFWKNPKEIEYPSEYRIELINEESSEDSIKLIYAVGDEQVEIIIKK